MAFYVIGISGKQHSGKTTLATALADNLCGGFRAAHVVKFAQPLYDISAAVNKIIGVTPLHKDGTLMQMVGAHIREKYGVETFVRLFSENAAEKLKLHLQHNDHQFVICDDLRFENEAEGLREFAKRINGKCVLVRLEATEETRKARSPATWRDNTEHPSEVGLDKYRDFDVFFGTETTSTNEIMLAVKKLLEVP